MIIKVIFQPFILGWLIFVQSNSCRADAKLYRIFQNKLQIFEIFNAHQEQTHALEYILHFWQNILNYFFLKLNSIQTTTYVRAITLYKTMMWVKSGMVSNSFLYRTRSLYLQVTSFSEANPERLNLVKAIRKQAQTFPNFRLF